MGLVVISVPLKVLRVAGVDSSMAPSTSPDWTVQGQRAIEIIEDYQKL